MGPARTVSGSQGTAAGIGSQAAGLDLTELDDLARQFFKKGVAVSTQHSYRSGQARYLTFCQWSEVRAVRTCEPVLGQFVSFMAKEGLKHGTIKAYLSAVHFLHIKEGVGDPSSHPYVGQNTCSRVSSGASCRRAVRQGKDFQYPPTC